MSESDFKRLFFAFEVAVPWPESLPRGRLLREEDRHLTVAFLGQTDFNRLNPLLQSMPVPLMKVGLSGKFDKIVFLPQAHPRVAAWHICWHDRSSFLPDYSKSLIKWLKDQGFNPDDKELMQHVTVCRAPFDFSAWRRAFMKLPLYIKNFHLYESLGQLHYKPVWSFSLQQPFEELDHTADVAFKIRGETVLQLYFNGLTALAFKYPELIHYAHEVEEIPTIEEVVIQLNQVVSRMDADRGCPFKAVSFHGDVRHEQDQTLSWEMIVDV